LAADVAVLKVVAALGRDFGDGEHMLVDGPGALDLRVDLRTGAAGEIGVKAEAAGHRVGAGVAAGETDREALVVEREMLPRFVGPGPFAVAVMVGQDRARLIVRL